MLVRASTVVVALFLVSFFHARVEAESPSIPPDVPRALTPDEARKTFAMAEGMTIELVASEPTVRQPVCITFDDRGRLWVLQYLQYPIPNELKPVEVDQYLRTKYDRVPEPPPRGPKGRDTIVILEDSDGDGRFRRHKDFITDLHLASGMALGYDGLFVVQPPYLLYYPDKNHDDVPDGDPEVLLKGFGMEDAHAFANSLIWGPDGWLYGAQGSTVTASIRGIEFQQGIWRYHPITRAFELFAEGGGNTWGIDFDRHGQLFAGGNTTEPLCHHVQGAYYIKGFGKHGPLHNPYSIGYFNPVRHQGFLGSSLTGGFVIYHGGLFSARFDGAVIYPNLRANAMRVSRLQAEGSTFTTHFQEDFIVSSDRWFRPVKSVTGPDGALYVADWYDYNISHTDPKDRSKWYIPSRDTGRIWRVKPAGTTPRALATLPLSRLTSDALVDLLAQPNAWYAREARRILMERRDLAVCPRLVEAVRGARDDRTALEALWALHVSGGLTEDLCVEFLGHRSEHVRAWAVRLLGDERRVSPRCLARLVDLARDEPSPTVRSQLACSCKRLPGADAIRLVDALLGRSEDLADPHIPLLLWWAVEDKAVSDRERVLALCAPTAAWNRPIMRGVIVERLARRYLAEGAPEGFLACARLLGLAPSAPERERLVRAMEEQMEGQHLERAPEALATALIPLLASANPSSALVRLSLRLGLGGAAGIATTRAGDRRLPAADRAEFVRALGELRRPAFLKLLISLLGDDEPEAVRTAALLALQRYEDDAIPSAVIDRYRAMPRALKDKARDVLASRGAWSARALAAAENGTIPAGDFTLDQVRRMVLHKESSLTMRAEKIWGQVRPATSREKQGRIMAVAQILAKERGDPARGKPLVVKTCLNCHQLFGEGERIGPDLTAIDRKSLDTLLQNVIDPAAVIREGYQQYNVATRDGRILAGLLMENSGGKVTVLDSKAVRTPLREAEVETITRAETSLMPEGLLDPFSDQELRDLFAYLRSEKSGSPSAGK
jgi:putative heme-binding domain-containing protein